MINRDFWDDPPWRGGSAKWRLGARPVALEDMLELPPAPAVLAAKRAALTQHYEECVAVCTGTDTAQQLLADQLSYIVRPAAADARRATMSHFGPYLDRYPDRIANLAAGMVEDICLLDLQQHNRLVCGCVCAPSYWRLRSKVGHPLRQVHGDVTGLQDMLGARIDRFLRQIPEGQPFVRRNWFVHGDAERFHLYPEPELTTPVRQWYLRSERQSLYRLSARYLAFFIHVTCEPLAHIEQFPTAAADLVRSLQNMRQHQIDYFGGMDKYRRLLEYVTTHAR